jgi:hypothetical protein
MATFGRRPPEKRGAPREKRRLQGSIVFSSAPALKCVVVELSKTGALLEVESILGIPDHFDLRIAGQPSQRVAVVRRRPGHVAVKFIGALLPRADP